MSFTPLHTDRLTLRGYEHADIPALVPLIGAPEVAATTLRIPHPYTEAYGRDFIALAEEEMASGKSVRLAIACAKAARFVAAWG
jgi:ribosomal-protein-alanine N-acetyltransferase